MADDDKSKLPGVVGAASSVVSTYKEEFRPAAPELAQSAEVVGRAVNLALSPVYGVVWFGEQVKAYVTERVTKKMARTPTDQIGQPSTSLVGPALEALRFKAEEPDLQEMFANLIATAMDKRTRERIHPSFVQVLKELTPDEAKILHLLKNPAGAFAVVHVVRQDLRPETKGVQWPVASNLTLLAYQADCENPYLVQSYLDNFRRLGLITMFEPCRYYTETYVYLPIEQHPDFKALKERHDQPPDYEGVFVRSGFIVTSFGTDFIRACVLPYEEREQPVLDE